MESIPTFSQTIGSWQHSILYIVMLRQKENYPFWQQNSKWNPIMRWWHCIAAHSYPRFRWFNYITWWDHNRNMGRGIGHCDWSICIIMYQNNSEWVTGRFVILYKGWCVIYIDSLPSTISSKLIHYGLNSKLIKT